MKGASIPSFHILINLCLIRTEFLRYIPVDNNVALKTYLKINPDLNFLAVFYPLLFQNANKNLKLQFNLGKITVKPNVDDNGDNGVKMTRRRSS